MGEGGANDSVCQRPCRLPAVAAVMPELPAAVQGPQFRHHLLVCAGAGRGGQVSRVNYSVDKPFADDTMIRQICT